MSALTGSQANVPRRADAGQSVVFERPAELVDISERLYRQIFAVGLWMAAGLSAFAAVASLLQPAAGSQLRGLGVCGAYAVACTVAARRPAALYAALRRQPWLLLMAGVVLGAGSWFVGKHNFQLFLPIVAVLAVPGIAVPLRVVAAAGLIAAVGLAAPQLTSGQGNLGGPIAVIVPPLLFWLIVERIASFALRLHQRLEHEVAPLPPAEHAPSDAEQPRPLSTPAAPRDDRPPRGLPVPRIIEVDGVRLTSRQLQVILLACEGLKHAEIGSCLGIGTPTVRRHLKKAKQRTGSVSTPQLVAWARRVGLVPG